MWWFLDNDPPSHWDREMRQRRQRKECYQNISEPVPLSPSPTVSVATSVVWTTLHHALKPFPSQTYIINWFWEYWNGQASFCKPAHSSAAGLFNRFNGRYKSECLTSVWSIMKGWRLLYTSDPWPADGWEPLVKLQQIVAKMAKQRQRQGPWLYGYINRKWRKL